MIRVPDWVENPLGKYYLYFADHKGQYIRLAYADAITGPWKIYVPGSLPIEDSFFAVARPPIAEDRLAELVAARETSGVRVSHDYAKELTEPHIASPDVHVDEENQRIIMYFHGLEAAARQHSRVATSKNGIDFETLPSDIGRTYYRAFAWDDMTYAIAMPGQFYRSEDGLKDFGYRDHSRRKVEAYQRCIRTLLGGCGVISIRDEDLGVVTGPSENRVDFGVDQLVLQHGELRGRSVGFLGFTFVQAAHAFHQ